MPENHEIDEIDVEVIWERICEIAAGRAGISSERAEAILEKNGFYAYGHTGLVEAVEVVSWGVRRGLTQGARSFGSGWQGPPIR